MRLQQIYDLLPKDGIGIVDVGTDHGLIPTRLALDHYRGNIIASDVVPGPLNTAKKYAKENRVENRIQFLLCDGLEKCPPEQIDTVVIAGMGGDTICGILDRAEWLFKRAYRLILQPMTHAEVLRYWLIHNEFRIDREALVEDGGHLYQIMLANPGFCRSLTDCEYCIGSLNTAREGIPVINLIDQQIERLEQRIYGMKSGSRQDSSSGRFYQNLLEELYAAKEQYTESGLINIP